MVTLAETFIAWFLHLTQQIHAAPVVLSHSGIVSVYRDAVFPDNIIVTWDKNDIFGGM